jgi:hypothetical protein
MKKIVALMFFFAICLQPLFCETLAEENGYVNKSLDKPTYFGGASSLEEQKPVRKPASLEKKTFSQRYFESKEDKFGYIFQQNQK